MTGTLRYSGIFRTFGSIGQGVPCPYFFVDILEDLVVLDGGLVVLFDLAVDRMHELCVPTGGQ